MYEGVEVLICLMAPTRITSRLANSAFRVGGLELRLMPLCKNHLPHN